MLLTVSIMSEYTATVSCLQSLLSLALFTCSDHHWL